MSFQAVVAVGAALVVALALAVVGGASVDADAEPA